MLKQIPVHICIHMITWYTRKPLVLSLWRTGPHVHTCHSRFSSKHNPAERASGSSSLGAAPREHACKPGEPSLEVSTQKYLCNLTLWSGSGFTSFNILAPIESNKVLRLTKLLFIEDRGTTQNLLDKGEGKKPERAMLNVAISPEC